MKKVKHKADGQRPDCMPNPIKAIQYVVTKQYSMVRSCNKEYIKADMARASKGAIPRLYIGSL